MLFGISQRSIDRTRTHLGTFRFQTLNHTNIRWRQRSLRSYMKEETVCGVKHLLWSLSLMKLHEPISRLARNRRENQYNMKVSVSTTLVWSRMRGKLSTKLIRNAQPCSCTEHNALQKTHIQSEKTYLMFTKWWEMKRLWSSKCRLFQLTESKTASPVTSPVNKVSN